LPLKENLQKLTDILSLLFPDAMAFYCFGSAATGEMREDSDIDLAVLSEEPLDPEKVFDLKSEISRNFRRDVDVVDLMRADSVTAVQVVVYGQLLMSKSKLQTGLFETTAMSAYALLNEERREILKDIATTGKVYAG
jgi:predicted nucleotidyltransferase